MPIEKIRTVVVTGIGVTLPGAQTAQQLWNNAVAGSAALTPATGLAAAGHPRVTAGQVADGALAVFPARLRKRMDRFCQLSMVAARQALHDANIGDDVAASGVDPARAGAYIGNMYGGWELTEPSLRDLSTRRWSAVSPYIATSWFPTAPQGQISIHWGLKGYSKTVVADTASAAMAVGYAARTIASGEADLLIAGGAEAPVTPYTYTFCRGSGRLSDGEYRPFTPGSTGFRIGEGAAVLVLESLESARRRGVPVLAEVAGFAAGHAYRGRVFAAEGAALAARVATEALTGAGVNSADVDYVGLDAQGDPSADNSELAALCQVFAGTGRRVPSTSLKPLTGHLLGAAAAVELVGALLALRGQAVPALHGADPVNLSVSSEGPDLVSGAARRVPIRTALVNARGADGSIASCVLRAG